MKDQALHDAERAVLGSMLRDNAVIGDVLQILRAEFFSRDADQRIFRAVVALFDQGRPVDLVLLAERLKEEKQIENVGGYGYLSELWDAAPTAANAEHYARTIRGRAILRSLHQVGEEIAADARDRVGPAEELLEAAERRVMAIAHLGAEGQTVDLKTAIGKLYDRLDARLAKGGRGRGLATGFVDLDELTAGLQDSELIIVAARPSVGKTCMGLSLARQALGDGHAVFFASLEQADVELAERLACAEAGIDGHKLRSGALSKDELAQLKEAGDGLARLPLFIDQSPAQSVLRISANARRHKLRHGIRLVVVDYLQLVEPENRREQRHEQVAGVSRRLKRLARDLAIPVVAMAQLNRGVEQRQGQEPRLSDLRESGAIEADADVVMLMHRPSSPPRIVEVIIAKQRNGPTGRVTLTFQPEYQRFENYAPDPL